MTRYFLEGNLFTLDVGNLSDLRPFFSFEAYVFSKLICSAASHFRAGFSELLADFGHLQNSVNFQIQFDYDWLGCVGWNQNASP